MKKLFIVLLLFIIDAESSEQIKNGNINEKKCGLHRNAVFTYRYWNHGKYYFSSFEWMQENRNHDCNITVKMKMEK